MPKKAGVIRICVDLKPLNEHVLREVHPLPKVDDTLAQMTGAKVFSKLDANSGFWQIPLAKTSRHLTTFITPFGRYYFNKLPFGIIASAPEHLIVVPKALQRQTLQRFTRDIKEFNDVVSVPNSLFGGREYQKPSTTWLSNVRHVRNTSNQGVNQ